jgi:hypothetical protein
MRPASITRPCSHGPEASARAGTYPISRRSAHGAGQQFVAVSLSRSACAFATAKCKLVDPEHTRRRLAALRLPAPCVTTSCGLWASPGVCSADSLVDRGGRNRSIRASTGAGVFSGRTAPPRRVIVRRRSCAGTLARSGETVGPIGRRQPADRRSADRPDYACGRCETLTTTSHKPGSLYYRCAADGEADNLVAQAYLLDNEPCTRRQRQLRIHRPPFGWPGDVPGRRGLPERSRVMQLTPVKA